MIPPEQLQVFGESLKNAREYLDLVLKPSLTQIGGMLEDTVQHWRLRNKVNLVLKTKKILESKGVTPKQLEPNIVVPLLDEAANTDDPTLSDMFANLMASELDADGAATHPSFAKTLGQLSPLDAKVLEMIDGKDEANWKDRQQKKANKQELGPQGQEYAWGEYSLTMTVRSNLKVTADVAALSIDNLRRLGLIEDFALPERDFAGAIEYDLKVTGYGIRFLLAVKRETYWRKQFEGRFEEFAKKAEATTESDPKPSKAWKEGRRKYPQPRPIQRDKNRNAHD